MVKAAESSPEDSKTPSSFIDPLYFDRLQHKPTFLIR